MREVDENYAITPSLKYHREAQKVEAENTDEELQRPSYCVATQFATTITKCHATGLVRCVQMKEE